MHRIHVRLVVMFVVIVTVILTLSGAFSQYQLSQELERRDAQLRHGVITRLQISLPSALWNLDKPKVDSLLEAEMLPPEVLGIRVYDTTSIGLFSGKMRDRAGQIVAADAASDIPGTSLAATLTFRGVDPDRDSDKPIPVGRVQVNFSREQINAALATDLIRKVAEILVLDIVLLLALSYSLKMVFEPLKQLRDGLFDLATRDTDEVVELPEGRRDEFGEVVRGFNRIQRKLKSIIESTRRAEDEARHASARTAQALQDLRQAQDSLVQAERLASLGGLVAGVAHEINTPVGITLTSASVLLDATRHIQQAIDAGPVKRSDILRYLETASEGSRLIMSNADRAAHLIQSFKQIAVDQTNEMRRPFKLKEYIDEIIMSLHPRLKHTQIQVVVGCADTIELDSYPGAFAQIITNLTLNALTHAYDANSTGTIRIDATQDGDKIALTFCDDGKGIPAENVDKIFDPFFTTLRGRGGTGLGLNIVYNLIVKQFGGTIDVESTLGQGTSFSIHIPRVAPRQEKA
ncbi:MAG: ATP-binding protein [Burkholderiaceae bacterium]|nr:ATP-binding protein [Burkholderiaceae bacterium]